MPVYLFVCEQHGEFEKITIKAEWDEIRCPKCGNKPKINKKSSIRNRTGSHPNPMTSGQ
jgi:putative FmdB family regulatory protein